MAPNNAPATAVTQKQAVKRKGTSIKQSTYILRAIFNNGHRYYILIDNLSKLIFLLGDRKKDKNKAAPPLKYEVSQFFVINS